MRIPFTGPFDLVNGALWSHFGVVPRWCRFRVLNASNSCIYQLGLVGDDGRTPDGAVYQIGTDSGPPGAPVPSTDGYGLAPAERVDLLVDFSRLARRDLELVGLANPGRGDMPMGGRHGHADGMLEVRLPDGDRRHRPLQVPLPPAGTRGRRHDAPIRGDAR